MEHVYSKHVLIEHNLHFHSLIFFTSHVLANAPLFVTTDTNFEISDSTALGTSVAGVTFMDFDASDTLTLRLSGGQSNYFNLVDNGDGTGKHSDVDT